MGVNMQLDNRVLNSMPPLVRARRHATLFFDIYNVFFVVSCQLICAESNSDVCQLVSVEHFFLWHEIQDGREKM